MANQNSYGNNTVLQDENSIKIEKCTCLEQIRDGLMSRCFMTGEQCPHRKRIVEDKIARHREEKLMVFMVMSFTPITNSVYRWMLKDMIKANTFVLLDKTEDNKPNDIVVSSENIDIRCGGDFAHNSNIICENICSAIQGADLIVVDVSYQNPNVFYELGLAIGLGKKILTICYGNNYYKRTGEHQNDIRSFPWKRELFEYFSLTNNDNFQSPVTGAPESSFKDYKEADGDFSAFPYVGSNAEVGIRLKNVMNETLYHNENLLIYNPQHLNKTSRSKYIENYGKIVKKIRDGFIEPEELNKTEEQTALQKGLRLRGDRILFLYSSDQKIVIQDKDKTGIDVLYDFGDIGMLAINQANHDIESNGKTGSLGYERILWSYVYNNTELQDMDHPVHVDLIMSGRYEELDILKKGDGVSDLIKKSAYQGSFTYLDVVLAKLQHCQTVMIDMRGNRIQALFWMGILHGRGRVVVPVHYETANTKPAERTIADIAGLWNAYFESSSPEKFPVVISNALEEIYKKTGHQKAYEKMRFLQSTGTWKETSNEYRKPYNKAEETMSFSDRSKLNTYYQTLFWKIMLAHGDVELWPSADVDSVKTTISNWDYNGMALIDSYVNRKGGTYRTILKDSRHYGQSRKKDGKSLNNVITLGDRNVNTRTGAELKEWEEHIFTLKKCDPVCGNPGYGSGNLSSNAHECKRGFVPDSSSRKNPDFGWMAKFYAPEEIAQLSEAALKEELILYGQLIFLRNENNRFSVILEGASGPATYSMADIISGGTIELQRLKNLENPGESVDPKKDRLLFYALEQKMLLECFNKLVSICEEKVNSINENNHGQKVSTDHYAPFINYIMLCLCDRFLPVTSLNFVSDLEQRASLFIKQYLEELKGIVQSNLKPDPVVIEFLNNNLKNDELKNNELEKDELGILPKWIEWFKTFRGTAVILKSELNFTSGSTCVPLYDDRICNDIYLAEDVDKVSGFKAIFKKDSCSHRKVSRI